MKELFKPVKPKRLSDEAIEQILGLVREGSLRPGDKLPAERQLMTLLGVSRTSLREAIRSLEIRGVLRVVPGKGTFVQDEENPGLSEGWMSFLAGHGYEVLQLLEMHEALEVKVAMMAAERATPQDIETLRSAMAAMRRAVDSVDHEGLVAADAAFHRALRLAGKNDLMTRVLDDLEDSVLDARRLVMALPGKPGRVIDEHQAVLDAVERGEVDEAGNRQLELVQRSKADIVGALAAREPGRISAVAGPEGAGRTGRST